MKKSKQTLRKRKAMLTCKEQVTRKHPTAVSRPPSDRGLYYGEWTVGIPPTASGLFGPMFQILGHGKTSKDAWADAAGRTSK
jgi:hypothetical protein